MSWRCPGSASECQGRLEGVVAVPVLLKGLDAEQLGQLRLLGTQHIGQGVLVEYGDKGPQRFDKHRLVLAGRRDPALVAVTEALHQFQVVLGIAYQPPEADLLKLGRASC